MQDEKHKGFGENVGSAFPYGSKMAAAAPNIMSLIPVSKSKKERNGKESSPCFYFYQEGKCLPQAPQNISLSFHWPEQVTYVTYCLFVCSAPSHNPSIKWPPKL